MAVIFSVMFMGILGILEVGEADPCMMMIYLLIFETIFRRFVTRVLTQRWAVGRVSAQLVCNTMEERESPCNQRGN